MCFGQFYHSRGFANSSAFASSHFCVSFFRERIERKFKTLNPSLGDSQSNILVPLPQAGFGGPHHSEKDVFVDDFKIPAGTDVYPDIAGILRNSTYWDNSDDFLPERFMEGQTNKHWIPFQIGGRSCPGKVILIKVVQ